MKILLILLLLVVVMLVANEITKYYRDRYSFYCQLSQFIEKLDINIAFQKNKLADIIKTTKAENQFLDFVKQYYEYITKNNEPNFESIKLLDDNEKQTLVSIIKSIGRNDVENEMKQINYFKKFASEGVLKTKEEKEKKVPLVLKLSFMLGLLLSILFL